MLNEECRRKKKQWRVRERKQDGEKMKWVLFRLQAEKEQKNRNWPLEERRVRRRES